MNDMKIFENSEFGAVRVVDVNGEPWFVAKDVCECLELGNPRTSIALLDEDEKGVHTMDTPGGQQEMSIVSEAGLYSLILRSRKPEAKAFKRWITHEVLPSIRRTGQYGGYALPRVPQSFPDALRMIADIEEEKQLALEQSGTTTSAPRLRSATDAKPRLWPRRPPPFVSATLWQTSWVRGSIISR